jgi:hypothetical protein
MKLLKLLALLSLISSGSLLAQPSPNSPRVDVSVESEARELSRGYAQAFSSLTRPPITMAVQKGGAIFYLEDVKSLRDSNGVLIAEVGRGMIYLINARDILYVTDGKPVQVTKDAAAK